MSQQSQHWQVSVSFKSTAHPIVLGCINILVPILLKFEMEKKVSLNFTKFTCISKEKSRHIFFLSGKVSVDSERNSEQL